MPAKPKAAPWFDAPDPLGKLSLAHIEAELKAQGHAIMPTGPDSSGGCAVTAKPSNPKDIIGSDKLPLHLWPRVATILGCLGLADGMFKYGRMNWREAGVRFSIYYDAAQRHMDALFEGEDIDPDSGLPHEAHALACLAIIAEARACGKLVDDRAYAGGFYRGFVVRMTAHMKRMRVKYAEAPTPHHYTITDNAPNGETR